MNDIEHKSPTANEFSEAAVKDTFPELVKVNDGIFILALPRDGSITVIVICVASLKLAP